MLLEKEFELKLTQPPEYLLKPELVFSDKPPFGLLGRDGERLWGKLHTEVPLFGALEFPFESRLTQPQADKALLEALPIEPSLPFWAELSGSAQLQNNRILYRLHVRIHAHLPEGEKWGGRALQRMAEATFERTLERALTGLAKLDQA